MVILFSKIARFFTNWSYVVLYWIREEFQESRKLSQGSISACNNLLFDRAETSLELTRGKPRETQENQRSAFIRDE